jgi:hypothetical protein
MLAMWLINNPALESMLALDFERKKRAVHERLIIFVSQ